MAAMSTRGFIVKFAVLQNHQNPPIYIDTHTNTLKFDGRKIN